MRLLAFIFAPAAYAISCSDCTSSGYNGDNYDEACWSNSPVSSENTLNNACSGFCFAEITWNSDGFPSSITRGCALESTISSLSTVLKENGPTEACVNSLDTATTDEVRDNSQTCAMRCDTDGCNSGTYFAVETLKECSCTDVNESCNYWTGLCYRVIFS